MNRSDKEPYSPDERQAQLRELADAIARRGIATPTRITLDALAPIDFISSQIALFFRPIMPIPRWRAYLDLLGDETTWQELRTLVNRRDC